MTQVPTPSSHVSRFEGIAAGFEAVLAKGKKVICCPPTVEEQEANARKVNDILLPHLEALQDASALMP